MKYTFTEEEQEYILSNQFLADLAYSNIIVIKSKVALMIIIKSKGEKGINAKIFAFSLYDDDYIRNIRESFKQIKTSYNSGIVICGYIEGMIAGSTEFGEVHVYTI